MADPGFRALMAEAAKASEDTTEVRDAEGRLARIERDPDYPGAMCIRLDATGEAMPFPTQWILPATNRRPGFFPDDVPFLPGIDCRAMEAGGRLFVTWRDLGCPVVDPEKVAEYKESMPPQLQEAMEAMKQRAKAMAAGAPGGEVDFKAFLQTFESEDSKEWMASMAGVAEPDPRYAVGFEEALRISLDAGWEEVRQEKEIPTAARAVSLRLGQARRTLVLSSMMGIGSLLLTEEKDESGTRTSR